jgi:hypothetical protein
MAPVLPGESKGGRKRQRDVGARRARRVTVLGALEIWGVGKAAASSGAYFLQATCPSVAAASLSTCARRVRPREQRERKGHGAVIDGQKRFSRVHVPLKPRPRPHPAPSTPWSVQASVLEKRDSTGGKHDALEGPRA